MFGNTGCCLRGLVFRLYHSAVYSAVSHCSTETLEPGNYKEVDLAHSSRDGLVGGVLRWHRASMARDQGICVCVPSALSPVTKSPDPIVGAAPLRTLSSADHAPRALPLYTRVGVLTAGTGFGRGCPWGHRPIDRVQGQVWMGPVPPPSALCVPRALQTAVGGSPGASPNSFSQMSPSLCVGVFHSPAVWVHHPAVPEP